MFIDRPNPLFPAISAHKKPVSAEWLADIAEYKEEVGFIDYDSPNAPRRKAIRSDIELRELEGARRIEAEKNAQKEYNEALARLADGSAVHRQANDRTQPAKRVKKSKAAKAAKAAKVAKKIAKPVKKVARKPYYHKVGRKLPSSQMLAKQRREEMIELLQAGEYIPLALKQTTKGEIEEYQQQYNDIKKIVKQTGIKVLRVKRIKDNQSFFAIDSFKRYSMEPVTGRLDDADRLPLIKALSSGDLVPASSIKNGTRIGVSSTTILARNHGMDIHTVFVGRSVIGWVLLEEKAGQ